MTVWTDCTGTHTERGSVTAWTDFTGTQTARDSVTVWTDLYCDSYRTWLSDSLDGFVLGLIQSVVQ